MRDGEMSERGELLIIVMHVNKKRMMNEKFELLSQKISSV
jgi:hypothetical protein